MIGPEDVQKPFLTRPKDDEKPPQWILHVDGVGKSLSNLTHNSEKGAYGEATAVKPMTRESHGPMQLTGVRGLQGTAQHVGVDQRAGVGPAHGRATQACVCDPSVILFVLLRSHEFVMHLYSIKV